MRDARGRSPRPVRAAEALAGLKAEIRPETPLARVQAVWADAVGEQIAAVTEVVEEVEGTLYIDCASAVWSQELSLMEPRLRENLAAKMDGEAPGELRFRAIS
jgi:predicted nucleic acid-binding Zn ribbon protein